MKSSELTNISSINEYFSFVWMFFLRDSKLINWICPHIQIRYVFYSIIKLEEKIFLFDCFFIDKNNVSFRRSCLREKFESFSFFNNCQKYKTICSKKSLNLFDRKWKTFRLVYSHIEQLSFHSERTRFLNVFIMVSGWKYFFLLRFLRFLYFCTEGQFVKIVETGFRWHSMVNLRRNSIQIIVSHWFFIGKQSNVKRRTPILSSINRRIRCI